MGPSWKQLSESDASAAAIQVCRDLLREHATFGGQLCVAGRDYLLHERPKNSLTGNVFSVSARLRHGAKRRKKQRNAHRYADDQTSGSEPVHRLERIQKREKCVAIRFRHVSEVLPRLFRFAAMPENGFAQAPGSPVV
jgi:hypothetical protein